MINHRTKAILSLLIIGFLIFYPIQTARSAAAIAYILKEFTLDLIARVLARTLLSNMINGVSGFLAKNGRDGLPNFVQDWRYFLEDAQYRGEDATRAIIGAATDASGGTICQYLRNPVAFIFGAGKVPGFNPSNYRVDSLQYYGQRNRCTLPSGFDVNSFRNDFSAGGSWAAWDKLIQPQNNFFGVYADSLDELGKQRNFEETRDRSEAQAGNGFTSKMGGNGGCSIRGGNSFCLVLGEILTPAKVLESAGSKLNTSEFDFITGCDEISECIFNVISSVTGRLASFATAKVGNQFTADTSQGAALCVQAGEGPCYEKAKKWDCDALGTGGSGGSGGGTDSGGGGGEGGSANTDCAQTIDQGIYDSCMAEVNASCSVR